MKEIPLTQGKVALVDDADFEHLSKFKWCAVEDNRTWYARTFVLQRPISMHRVLLPGIKLIDHEDGNGLNNQRHNLRPCLGYQNQGNRKKQLKKTSSKFKGVHWNKHAKRWRTQIKHEGKQIYLGYFSTEEDAARRYNQAAIEKFGNFAKINIL